MTGSPHSWATSGSPVTSSVSSTTDTTTTAAAAIITPLSASQHNKGTAHTCVCVGVHDVKC